MRNTLLTLLVVTVSCSFCFIFTPQAIAGEAVTFTGTIESFRPVMGKPPKWLSARFTAVSDSGERKEIWILGASSASPTSVIDSDGKPVDKPGYNHRPKVGKKVEVRYVIANNGRNEALSIRYVPADYVSQPTASTAPTMTSGAPVDTGAAEGNTFVGKVVKGGVTFSLKCPYRFTITADNGETKGIWIPRGNLRITHVNGKTVVGAPPRKGKTMEVKYVIGDNGQWEAVSMRYLD